ncbi:glycosyltransferase family 2 protein [Flavobacterium sp.]|jgi:glycosyltransferase involved in cell wall biosynthesis|uniref:glycosyltransferase family 2 protein n=1 Tax=Flavobacterium sp. TaxID=239 RepID=UPI0037BF0279
MLSILIPTYNYFVENLVNTLHKQCISEKIGFEIIVLEDSSSENYISQNKSISSLTNCYYEVNQKNFGRTKTRQILAERAKFDWVLFLDADVIPENGDFIKNYITFLNSSNTVVFGGYKYQNNLPEASKILRYKYGKEREEKPVTVKTKKPFQFVFSGNILIQKQLFLELNYTENEKFYGMDIYFAYQLFSKKITPLHIENAIYHVGLESNDMFFEKSLQSVVSRKRFLVDKVDIEKLNPLLAHYKKIKKYRLIFITRFLFKISEQFLKRNILSKNPNLFYFDLYRLGYICSEK